MKSMQRTWIGFLLFTLLGSGVAEAQPGGLPRPSEAAQRGTSLIFPSVIDWIYDGEFDVVPDDQLFRTYIVSVMRGISDSCPGGDGIGLAASTYGFEQVRRMRQNPGSILMDVLTGLVAVRQEFDRGGDIFAAMDRMSTSGGFMAEGVEDGRALVLTYKCNSFEIRRLRSRLDQLTSSRQFAPREPDDRARFIRLMHPQWRALFAGAAQAGAPLPSPTAAAERQRRIEQERRRQVEEERRAFEQARSSRDPALVNAYLTRYPNGAYVREVSEIRDALDEAAFRAAQAQNTPAALERYLQQFPGGRHQARVRAALTALDAEAFRAASTQNTTHAYQEYLRRWTQGQHRAQAQEALRTLERNAYDEARRSGTIAAYERYLNAYPNGQYTTQARTLINLTRQVEETEREVRAQRSVASAAQGRATLYGGASLLGLASAGVLGYVAYREYSAAVDLENQLNQLDPGSSEYQEVRADRDGKVQSLAIYGAGALAALYVVRMTSNQHSHHQQEATRARNTLQQLEQRRDRDRQRIRELSTVRLSVVPHLSDRLEPGIAVNLRF